jgi:hypothetical protein
LSTLLDDEENKMQQDLSSARVKTGLAANLHYVWLGHKDTQSIILHNQIKALLKKNYCFDDGMELDDTIHDSVGEIHDLYEYLEQPGSHYVSLLAGIVPEVCGASPSDSPCKTACDATTDSNKEGRLLVTVSSTDPYEKIFIVI